MNFRKLHTVLFLIVGIIMSSKLYAQDPNFHIYICFGQSNMEGSAEIEEQDLNGNARFKVLQSVECENLNRDLGKWYTAKPPLSHCYAGLSPADYFGKTMIEKLPEEITVGVLNIAIGGCDIRIFDKDIYQGYDSTYTEDWFVDKVKAYYGNPYERLIEMAKIAKNQGVIKGMLLHQGETNTGDKNWPYYVKKIYLDILGELNLNANAVPLLAGEVVGADQDGECALMNPIISELPNVIPTAYVISSKGCKTSDDRVHFNSEGVRELGKRYAEKMIELSK